MNKTAIVEEWIRIYNLFMADECGRGHSTQIGARILLELAAGLTLQFHESR
tara:strand:- start:105 stop:257 length:153 start_codon:yes stop_codon:yes gene_type:complete